MCKLIFASVICTVIMTAEIVGGIMSGSIALISDAFHMLSDQVGFFISLFSLYIG